MKPTPLNQTKKTIGLTLFISLILFSSLQAATIYVKANNTGLIKNGSSWTYAYANFQNAVDAAQSGDEIWVAVGEYQPANLKSFSMKEGVKIYGGFVGTETRRSQRNWQTNVTILKGNNVSVISNSGLTTTAVLDGFTITNGSAANGGAIYNTSSSPVYINVTISGNSSPSSSGAIYNNVSNPIIKNSIIYGNSDGVFNISSTPNISYSLVQGMAADAANHNLDGATNPNFISPLAPALSSGGDYRLQNSSPAIGAGNNTFYAAGQTPDLSAITTDLAGNARIQKGKIDLGAYESEFDIALVPDASGVIYVTTAGAGNKSGNSWTNASDDLQMAINAANVKQVWVAAGEYQPANLNSFKMKEGVKIYGGFAGTETILSQRNYKTNVTNLKGNNNSVIRNNNNGLTAAAVLDGFTITNGYADNNGGGVYNYNSSPILSNLIIAGNSATNGGGIFNVSSSPVLTNVTISGNLASSTGGGVYSEVNCSLTLTNVTISGNSANFSSGIFNYQSNYIIRNSIVYRNNYVDESSVIYANSRGIGGAGGTVDIKYSLVQGVTTADANGNIDGATNPNFLNPLAPGLNNGGDYRLQSNSPAIGTGSNAFYAAGQTPNLSAVTTDLDGSPRIQKNVVDMGAYESEFYPLPKPDANGIIYVSAAGNGNYDGASWANATPALQVAINAAQSGNEVWVVAGEYQPGSGQSFSMKEGVKIYGGFTGTETALTQRNYKTNVTTLKGNNASVIINQNNGLTAIALLDGFTITGGSATNGGGIFNNNTSPALSNLTISGNNATNGGGIFNNNSSPVLTNVSVSANSVSRYGGGIYNTGNSSSPVLTNVILSGNSASQMGGGIYNNSNTSSILTNVSISANNATTNGGGIYNASNSTCKIRNSIIYGNNTGIYGSTPDVKYSLVQGLTATTDGNIDGTTNPNFVSPLTAGLNAGGNYRLQSNSPTIGTGSNTFYAVGQTPDLSTITTDLDGNPRIQKANIDMGAYESEFDTAPVPDTDGIIYVSTTGNGNFTGNSWANASPTLQAAINAVGAQQVWVAAGEYQPASGQSFSMKEGVKIYGGFTGTETALTQRNYKTNVSTLKGNNSSVIYNNNNGLTAAAVLDGFTITNGSAGADGRGGGIYNSSSSPVLSNLIISGNRAGDGNGGGIYNSSSSPVLTNVTISLNNAINGNGGGIYNSSSSPVLTNVVIRSNFASYGGGIYNSSSSPVLTNVTISANSTIYYGAGIYDSNSTCKIRNSIIYGNNTNGIFGGGSDIKYSLVQGVTFADANGNIAGSTNPEFVDAANGDFSLKNTSPLINNGSDTFFAAGQTPDLSAITTDLAGNPRIQKANIDMGAYESSYNTPLMPDADNIIYVSTTGNGNFKGDSWANAVPNLADALLWAQQTQISRTSTNPLKIYIAKGTYKPLYNAADGQNTADGGRDNAFVLSKNVKVYGGFDPANNISTLVNQRIFGENGTILSGDIGIQNDNSDNAYHVVISAGDLGATLLDGVVIEEGRAENPGGVKIVVNGENIYRNAGAGFYNNGASNVLKNVLIRNNYSEGHGSGVYNDGASINQQATHLLVSNSIISNNSGNGEGSFTCSGATATYLNTNFISNSGAAAQDSHNSTTNVFNSIWYNNGSTTPSCTNSTKIGVVKNSIVVSLAGVSFELQAVREEPTNLMFESSQVSDNDLFGLTATNPGINKGSNAAYTANGGDLTNDKDMANNNRVYGGGTIDIGAYEYQSTLPVSLLTFTAKADGNRTKLTWQTTAETNNALFVVYRSSNGTDFTAIDQKAGLGTSATGGNYLLYDNSPLNGTNYYKLVQIDKDGTATDLDTKTVSFNFQLSTFNLYPNPAKDHVNITFAAGSYSTVQLHNIQGQLLQTIKLQENHADLRISVAALPTGVYYVSLTGKGVKEVKKLLVIK
ncbi:choice-of-anchor Q domain-containing protein [Pedobacter sp. UBA4863]|uniref:choice-of-anchor Q domain-containing protein n=1 Tax=Pedobacter sp. UBA4863 TaxID=1947060 RepID=UPI0025F9F506|nr:choice-of-anchor Q domain-containing protein [Pedobacter sp. UBA4863]